METCFHQELEDLKQTLLRMASSTERAMEKLSAPAFNRDLECVKVVIENDHEINLLEVQVDRTILKSLALAQPMARDRRFIVTACGSAWIWKGSATRRLASLTEPVI